MIVQLAGCLGASILLLNTPWREEDAHGHAHVTGTMPADCLEVVLAKDGEGDRTSVLMYEPRRPTVMIAFRVWVGKVSCVQSLLLRPARLLRYIGR